MAHVSNNCLFLVIHELKMIHTDLKPENILLKNHEYDTVLSSRAKVFGKECCR